MTKTPLHEVEAWPDRSVYAALAWSTFQAQEHANVCPSCNTSRDGWKRDDGRVARLPDYVLEELNCEGCRRLAEAQAALTDDERKYVRMRFRSADREQPPIDD